MRILRFVSERFLSPGGAPKKPAAPSAEVFDFAIIAQKGEQVIKRESFFR